MPSGVEHHETPPYDKVAHPVQVRRGTPLFDAVGVEEMGVNSYHHQGIRRLGQGLEVAATAPDGMVEAVYLPEHPFALAVQWHPEFSLTATRAAGDFPGLCAGVRRGPSEARVKFFGEAFFKKASTLPLTLLGGSHRGTRETAQRFSRTVGQREGGFPGAGLRGSAGGLPSPLTNAAERGTIEIEKRACRKTAGQVMKLLYEKVADSLDGGGYFFVS